ncbi:hypothetical protein D3C72_1317180 [compost metagenome]
MPARRPVAKASSSLPHSRLARHCGTAFCRALPSLRYSAGSAARRSSYGGLQTTAPISCSGVGRSATSARVKRMAWATPATSAFSRAAWIATGSMSLPWTTGFSAARPAASRSRASLWMVFQAALSKPSQRLGGRLPWRIRPGATSAAISAPSISRVPLPHIGSSRPPPAACRRGHCARISSAAARFSFNGASCAAPRQPRRCSGPPPRSIDSEARPLRSDRLTRTSGRSVLTEGRSSPSSRMRSTMASLIRCAAKRAWVILSPDTCASTARVISGLMCSCHGSARTPSYSACSSGHSNSSIGHSTRLASRDHMTIRSACSSSPSALTPAMVAVAFSRPRADSSSASRYSRPLAQETKNFTGSVRRWSGTAGSRAIRKGGP